MADDRATTLVREVTDPAPAEPGQPAADDRRDDCLSAELLAEDLLVEEISIDGMCGVY